MNDRLTDVGDRNPHRAREDRVSRRPAACVTASEFHAERFCAPTLEHYRAVYTQAGAAWPGEAFVRRHYPATDAS